MTTQEYSTASSNMQEGINDFLNNKFVRSIIPEPIMKTLELLVEYIASVRGMIFSGGKIKSLNLLNIVVWWRFVVASKKFVEQIINIWKKK